MVVGHILLILILHIILKQYWHLFFSYKLSLSHNNSWLLFKINPVQGDRILSVVCYTPDVHSLVCSGKTETHFQLSHFLKGLVTSRSDMPAQLLTCRQLTPDSRILLLFSACHPSTRYLTSLSRPVIVKDPFYHLEWLCTKH